MAGTFNEADKALIREIAVEVSKVIILEHVASCPWGKRMTNVLWLVVGLALGIGALSGMAVARLAPLL